MTPTDVLEYYKSYRLFWKATQMSANSLWNWCKKGYIPFSSQQKIEQLTKGKLKAVWADAQAPDKK